MTSVSQTIGIAGAGLMGRVLAWHLTQLGYKVTLFDRDAITDGSAAAYTAAGMLAPLSELESAEDLVYALGQRSLILWPQWVKQLNAEQLFHQGGTLVVAHPQDKAHLEHFSRVLFSKLDDREQVDNLSTASIADIEPELAQQFNSALWLKSESWLHTHELMAQYAQQLLAADVTWYENTHIEQVQPHCIIAKGERMPFDWAVDCRGLGAKQNLSLRGVRGEVIEVHAPEVNINRMVRLMHPRYRLYLVPRDNQHYLLGATQIESEDTSPISVRSALELLSALYAIHRGFGEARILATRTNCRPALINNQPIIHSSAGLLQINGLFRHGYLMAPALAEQAAGIIAGNAENLPSFDGLHQTLAC